MRDRVERRGLSMREDAIRIARKRKEGYLGARVSKELREWVIQRANDMGVPVSILIRDILEDAFRNRDKDRKNPDAGNISPGAGSIANRFSSVLGWEDIRLNKTVDCSNCGRRLEPKVYVTLGLAGQGEEPIIICDKCRDLL